GWGGAWAPRRSWCPPWRRRCACARACVALASCRARRARRSGGGGGRRARASDPGSSTGRRTRDRRESAAMPSLLLASRQGGEQPLDQPRAGRRRRRTLRLAPRAVDVPRHLLERLEDEHPWIQALADPALEEGDGTQDEERVTSEIEEVVVDGDARHLQE